MPKEDKIIHEETQRRLALLDEGVKEIKDNHLAHIGEDILQLKQDVKGISVNVEWLLWGCKCLGAGIILGILSAFLKIILP